MGKFQVMDVQLVQYAFSAIKPTINSQPLFQLPPTETNLVILATTVQTNKIPNWILEPKCSSMYEMWKFLEMLGKRPILNRGYFERDFEWFAVWCIHCDGNASQSAPIFRSNSFHLLHGIRSQHHSHRGRVLLSRKGATTTYNACAWGSG